MKILFYDIKDFELEYLTSRMINLVEPYFFKISLNNNTYIEERLKDAEAISIFVSSDLDKNVLCKFKNLKYIFLRCVGFSNIDMNYCKKNNIEVFNTPSYGNSTVAEYAFSLILALSKKLLPAANSIKTGNISYEDLCGVEIASKTIGVIGLGAIGRKIVNIAHGFDMEVIIYDIEKKGAYNFVEFDDLIQKADFIVLACPLTNETKALINKKTISEMKKTASIINIARGEIIDTQALYNALVCKQIKAAALDVIECEELLMCNNKECMNNSEQRENCLKKYIFAEKLLKLDNVILTPHNAYNTKEALTRILKITLENINQVLSENTSRKNLVLI